MSGLIAELTCCNNVFRMVLPPLTSGFQMFRGTAIPLSLGSTDTLRSGEPIRIIQPHSMGTVITTTSLSGEGLRVEMFDLGSHVGLLGSNKCHRIPGVLMDYGGHPSTSANGQTIGPLLVPTTVI